MSEASRADRSASSSSSGSVELCTNRHYVIEGVEDLECYQPGGYHLIGIGDRLNGRYKIIQKLGFGSYSTIWLARDEQCAKNVAVKIAIAENDRPHESIVLSILQTEADEHDEHLNAGKAAIPRLLDEFQVTGVNGSHHCLVTSPARASLRKSIDGSRFLLLPVARAIAAQMVQAVAFLHAKGVVHGDLNFGNILFDMPESIKNLTRDELYAQHGEPVYEEVVRIDEGPIGENVPRYGVYSARFWNLRRRDIQLEEAKVLLADYGESFQPASTTRLESRTPLILHPPEQLTGDPTPIMFPSDVWALGCTIFQILGHRSFIEGFYVHEDRALSEQVEVLGRLPPNLWASWKKRGEYFDDALERVDGKPHKSFRERMDFSIGAPRREQQSVGEMEEDETQALEDLLRSMLALDADGRVSARQALESEWMVKWALPDLERARSLWGDEYGSVACKSPVDIARSECSTSTPYHVVEEKGSGGKEEADYVLSVGDNTGTPCEVVEKEAPTAMHDAPGKVSEGSSKDITAEKMEDGEQGVTTDAVNRAERSGCKAGAGGQEKGCVSS